MSMLLASAAFASRVRDEPLVLVDVGARGDLQPPFDAIAPAALQVIGFEPDADECARLNTLPGSARYLPVAVWSRAGVVDVHVARTPSCSSVHPPDAGLLARYDRAHVMPRDTVSVVRYPTTTLDAALDEAGLRADVVKVDTQGAEREILQGAAATLRDDVLALIVETWTVPIHAGQGLTGEIMQMAADAGLTLFDVDVAAAWTRRSHANRALGGKRQIVGLDLLFLRDPTAWEVAESAVRRAKGAAVAEAFGFPDVALELLAADAELSAVVLAAAAERVRRHRFGRLRRLLGQNRTEHFASLHA